MILADLHNHTRVSHGEASVAATWEAARKTPLAYFGFSEHSPLPPGYECPLYSNTLEKDFPLYIEEVYKLRTRKNATRALLGIELDWLPSSRAWTKSLLSLANFDYVLGSLHFLDGESISQARKWTEDMPVAAKYERFCAYFAEMRGMVASGLIQTAAHPDYIKLRVWRDFKNWLALPEAREIIKLTLASMAAKGVAMEVNSAGLRQHFREPYPAPEIMKLAREAGVLIQFGSDSHRPEDIGANFAYLRDYAKSFGFNESVVYVDKKPLVTAF